MSFGLLPGGICLILLLSTLPSVTATSPTFHGAAVSCINGVYCRFTITGPSGNGTAVTGLGTISFQLPGELNTTPGIPYTNGLANGSASSTWRHGTFIGADVNSGRIVSGHTDTNISVTKHCGYKGCSYSYKLINGSIDLLVTKYEATRTSVTCSPSSFAGGGNQTVCTATVVDLANASKVPTGNVTWSAGYSTLGHFSSKTCKLVSGSCSVKFRPADETVGGVAITAKYPLRLIFYPSAGTADIYVSGS